ncbi:MAG: excinuclease ABC subunit UvrA, partial [Planctomycetota bacterium]
MTEGTIEIRRACQNNLAGVDVSLPRERLIAITGVSGSGKSSLAFDTLFREGQRRFLETLSAYARQFLGQMQKPEVESIEGLSPAIAVDQKSLARGARSTVGTLTEIADHLRVLWARAGQPHCPKCDLPVESRTPEEIVQAVLRDATGKAVHVLSPRIRDRKGHHKPVFEDLRKKGFVRARVDGEIVRLEEAPELSRYKRHTIEVVVDRLKPDGESLPRLREAVAQALELGDGDLILDVKGEEDRRYSTLRTCPGCGGDVPLLEPRLFSFNSPHGACPTCEGLGILRRPSEAALIADPKKSIREGALAVTRASGGGINFPRASFSFLETVAEASGFDLDTPWEELSAKARRVILHGTGQKRFEDTGNWNGAKFKGSVRWKRKFLGVLPSIERDKDKGLRGKQAKRFLAVQGCPDCEGHRLRPAARAVRL